MKDLKDRVAVITGTASGFGKAFVEMGATLGMKLVLADIQAEPLDTTPDDLANTAGPTRSQAVALAQNAKATGAAKVTAGQIAQMTFDAIRQRDFYIYSHPHLMGSMRDRFEAIVERRNPPDPYSGSPALRAQLMEALRA
ncbi:SDR family NAD(P)-dependent oxidoreductase [Cupriavidus sp. IDO]|uniref:SDR family NAD(P)-dependent oxidoreductase n=1 Tax=Cupriavidus sp. IDO TaxID=1539142 RepID=UPI00068ADD5A|nr:SDR family NAD(P)-dependent oxidoreductase [Cupriavidus sp. IDO]KWR88531.1 hypothetical protein RM96_19240 [Cupriavidus sp. IDO]